MTALIYGASGLIGSYLLDILLSSEEFTEIRVAVRKPLKKENEIKLKEVLVSFDNLNEHQNELIGDHVFCCLGTTKNKTPDQADYYKIDHDYPLAAAAIAMHHDAVSFHLVSAIGADASSSVFYAKTKGELEESIKALPFKSLHIYRPSLLTGDRTEKRPMEEVSAALMKFINPILIGGLKKYQSIPAETVALAMYKESLTADPGIFIHQSDAIKEK